MENEINTIKRPQKLKETEMDINDIVYFSIQE